MLHKILHRLHLFSWAFYVYLPHIVNDWNRWYMRWDRRLSAGMMLLGIAVVACASVASPFTTICGPTLALATTAWAVSGLVGLYRSVSRHTTADRITTFRLCFGSAAIVLLASLELFLPFNASAPGIRLLVGTLFAVALLSDFLDGRIARHQEAGRFGEEWDMQNDAAFAMLLSVAAVVFVGIEPWVMLIGLARYSFVLAVPGAHDRIPVPPLYALFGKTVCALTALTLSVVVAGGWAGTAATLSLALVLFATLSSFGSSIYLLRKQRAPAYVSAAPHGSEQVHTGAD